MAVDAWFSDQTSIFVQKKDGSETNFTVKVLSISESGFERETEGIVTFGDGRIVQKKPQKDGKVEIELVMTDTTEDAIFWGSTGTGAPALVESGGDQDPYRVTIVRTAATTLPTAATAAITGETYRRSYANAYAVTLEPEHEADSFLKAKLTFTIAPMDADADPNVRSEYNATSLSGLNAYTTSNKF